MSERDEARRKREEARRRRRGPAEAPETARDESPAEESPDESQGALAQAVKVAAAAAAVGAAAGAARAIAERDGHEDRPSDQAVHEGEHPAPGSDSEADDAEAPRPDAQTDEGEGDWEEPEPAHEPVAGGSMQQTTEVVRRAREQLTALRGTEPESVSELERTPDGWTVTFEVVEVARVPDTTDVMASYELVLDDDANLVRYARIRRYSRAQAEHEDGP